MPNDEMVAQTKPSEMSFSDWKKMKMVINTNVDSTVSKTCPPRSKNLTKSASKNFNNNYNRECRDPQNMPYFEQLKQNNQHIFGGGFFNNLPVPQSSIFNNPAPNIMMGNKLRPNYQASQPGTNHLMTGNNFMMPRGDIPQQPFPINNNHSNKYRMGNSFCSTNKQASFNFTCQRRVTKHKVTNINSTQTKVTEEITTAPNTSSKHVEPANLSQDTEKSKSKKQKRWNVRPPKPPSMIASTPESKEEKRLMWREYRQKMKPFKNRDFHNAKRVVQRLGKKNIDELDEKDKERLTRAKETVATHKAMLTKKSSRRWTLANDSTSNPTTSIFVSTPVTPPLQSTVPLCSKLENENDSNQSAITTNPHTNGNQWSLWNNFVPGSVV